MKFKLSNLTFLLFPIIAIAIAFFLAESTLFSGIPLVIASLGLLTLLVCFVNQKAGIIIAIILSFFISLIYRYFSGTNLPVGTAIEIIIITSFLGIFFKKLSSKDHNWSFINNPITYALLLFFLFNLIQFANPYHFNPTVTFIIVKRHFCMLLFYIICVYLFQDKKFTFNIMKLWIGLSAIVAIYACYQEWFGFFEFEKNWLYSSDDILRLFYIGGKFRKFSILNNPTIMGIIVSMSAIFLITLLMGKFSILKKTGMLALISFMLLAVGYSGTRTAYAMIVGGFVLLMLMNIQKRSTIVIATLGIVMGIIIMYGPYTNSTILRIRSAFYPENDASYNARDRNRASIKPFIYAHPIGAGLGTSGAMGKQMNPGQQLAGFPPDSEYLKTALELGYIGYFVLLAAFFIILNSMVNKFYQLKNNQLKIYYSAIIVALFSYIIANYAQETSGMFPNDTIFYILFAFGAAIYKFDINFNKNYIKYEN